MVEQVKVESLELRQAMSWPADASGSPMRGSKLTELPYNSWSFDIFAKVQRKDRRCGVCLCVFVWAPISPSLCVCRTPAR